MFVKIVAISGLMCGIEYLWDERILVIDLGIVRIYTGIVPKHQTRKSPRPIKDRGLLCINY